MIHRFAIATALILALAFAPFASLRAQFVTAPDAKVYPSSAFASLPSASTVASGTTYLVTDVGINGSLWRSNGTGWVPASGQPITLFQTSIPFVIPAGNGSTIGWKTDAVLTDGTFSLTTVFEGIRYNNCYMYFPANFGGSSLAAGWYFVQMSSTTAGKVFNNTYTSGTPTLPASPTSFAGGTFTTSTWLTSSNAGGYQTGPQFTLPGNVLGINGRLTGRYSTANNNSGTTKYTSFSYGSTDTGVLLGLQQVTITEYPYGVIFGNQGSATSQVASRDDAGNNTASGTVSVDSTSSQTVAFRLAPQSNADTVAVLGIIAFVTSTNP